jgi:DNA replication and repair protein RecF
MVDRGELDPSPTAATAVRSLATAGLRNLADATHPLAPRLTLVHGPNGAGKSSLLEGLCLALTARSPRTARQREAIAFGAPLARAEVEAARGSERSRFLWSVDRAGERRHLLDGKPAGPEASRSRPPLAVFVPDRLELIKGGPGPRRARLDRLAATLWPARAGARERYRRALGQRNALLARARGGAAPALEAWDLELATAGIELARARREAVERLAGEFAAAAADLGLAAGATIAYRPRSDAGSADELAAELRARRDADLARGFSTHGPHLDEVEIALGGRAVRRYASQGEQRAALLALLFAERRLLLEAIGTPPLMVLDDVMSELDPERRARLAARLLEGGGQALITATEPAHLPAEAEREELALRSGRPVPRSVREAA